MAYRPGTIYRDSVPCVYDGGDYPFELRRALELADYDGWRKRQKELRTQGRYVGVGISSYLEAGGVGWPCEGATVKVDDQGRVEVMIGVSQSGQGHETVFAQVAAQYLGASFDDVRVRGGDTSLIAYGFGRGRAGWPSTPATPCWRRPRVCASKRPRWRHACSSATRRTSGSRTPRP